MRTYQDFPLNLLLSLKKYFKNLCLHPLLLLVFHHLPLQVCKVVFSYTCAPERTFRYTRNIPPLPFFAQVHHSSNASI
ncbi:hypothetical protein Hanom_Chr02g00133131 [Helianthus anomalus]